MCRGVDILAAKGILPLASGGWRLLSFREEPLVSPGMKTKKWKKFLTRDLKGFKKFFPPVRVQAFFEREFFDN